MALRLSSRCLGLLGLLAAPALAAVIERSLEQMASPSEAVRTRAEDAIAGRIVACTPCYLDTGGLRMQFTRLEVEGVSLFDGVRKRAAVHFVGGPDELNFTMPALEDTRPGTRVVAFTAFCPTMGGGAGLNSLVCGFAGLYRLARNAADEDVVIGRGPGCAIERTTTLAELQARINAIRSTSHPTPEVPLDPERR